MINQCERDSEEFPLVDKTSGGAPLDYIPWAKSTEVKDIWKALISLFSSTFGLGFLGLTAMMAQAGIGGWCLACLIGVTANYVTFDALLYFADKMRLIDYVDVVQTLESKRIKTAKLFLFLVSNFGILLASVAVSNALICQLFIERGFSHRILVQKESLLWVIVPCVLLYPVLLKHKLKDITFMTFLSPTAGVYILLFLLGTFLRRIFWDPSFKPFQSKLLLTIDFQNFPKAFGLLLLSYSANQI